MRTTITLEDQIAKALKNTAHRTGKPFKQVVNETLRAGLRAGEAAGKPRPYRIKPVSLGGVMPGVDIRQALRLADALEDEEIARKLMSRK
jgi:hypothetical protein